MVQVLVVKESSGIRCDVITLKLEVYSGSTDQVSLTIGYDALRCAAALRSGCSRCVCYYPFIITAETLAVNSR